jgi:hypothetical protein
MSIDYIARGLQKHYKNVLYTSNTFYEMGDERKRK